MFFEDFFDIIFYVKKCSRCKKEKIDTEFNFKNKAFGVRHLHCKECTRLLIKNHYNKNKQYYLEKAATRNNKFKLEIHSFLRDFFKKRPCIDCGESDLRVLEFDHKNKFTKFKAVSSMIRLQFPIEKIKEEIEKCDVRCANCHRKKTARDFNWFRN